MSFRKWQSYAAVTWGIAALSFNEHLLLSSVLLVGALIFASESKP